MRFDVQLLQWPALIATAIAAWAVGSRSPRRRAQGFHLFLLGNVLWTVWGVFAAAWAVVVLQAVLAFINIRGARKARQLSRGWGDARE